MNGPTTSGHSVAGVCLAAGMNLFVAAVARAAPETAPPVGLRENTPQVHALVAARIVTAPGAVIESGTLVVRDGVIEAVGADVAPPADARVWDLKGKTIYPGFFDAFGELSADASRHGVSDRHGAGYWNAKALPHVDADDRYSLDAEVNKKLRSQGITARLVAPSVGVIKGTSAIVSTGDEPGSRAILKPEAALHLMLAPWREGEPAYPLSPMGAVALVRQTFYDARWYGQVWEAFQRQSGLPRPERSAALEALQPYVAGKAPVMIRAQDELYFLRGQRIAEEFGLQCIVQGSGQEYRRLDAVRATGLPVVVPLNFPKAPAVSSPEAAMSVPLDRLMHWDLAPENPGRLEKAGVRIAFTTYGLADAGGFLAAVRKAVERGLSPDAALRALTVTPATLFDLAARRGTLAAGKAADLVVTDGDLFDKRTKIVDTWVEGRRYEVETAPLADVRGTWELQLAKPDGGTETLAIVLDGEATKFSGRIRRGDKEAALTQATLEGGQFGATFKADTLGWQGVIQLSGTVSHAGAQTGAAQQPSWLGFVVWADGNRSAAHARRTAGPAPSVEVAKATGDEHHASQPAGPSAGGGSAPQPVEPMPNEPPKSALFPVNFPLGAFGVAGPPEQPRAVAFQHATVWTGAAAGVLDDASVVVEQGKIAAVGRGVPVPEGAVLVDCTGRHVTAGIIDCHSHIATDGGINEQGQTITAEVRIGDFIDPNDVNIYRQLAGGVTAANILHGSSNTIGGQNQVIKFRWGALPEEMKFVGAPPGIKFALGENVKQSNWGPGTRYPHTRMGVEQLVRDAFRAAIEYRRRWNAWREKPTGLPPRTDLELEALAEVVEGQRWIHCHSYRQDEILALLRTCEEFGVRVRTLQHVLEGYKVADVIARHGAGASSFSDWWAFKFEVYDAIPYNGALMHRAGVLVSFNSDDSELARRLNTEAAKAVKYGDVPPAEAWQFVTLNAARQLGVDTWVGSLEAGKDADLVVWSGPPLSTQSRCEQTWIDGRKYFDRNDDLSRRTELARMRAALVQRVLASGEPTESPDDARRELYPREDIFCHDDHDETGVE